MNIKTSLLPLISLIFALPLYSIAADREFVDLAKSAKPAVLLLLIRDVSGRKIGSGTGFFVGDSGRVVTNYHVIEHADAVDAELADGRRISIAGLLAEDKANDIAILQTDFHPSPTEILPLALVNRTSVEPGERVYVIGAPKGLAGTVSEGIVSAIRKAEDLDKFDNTHWKVREPLLQITAAISPGSSGSPVIDKDGQAIGVAVSNLSGGQNLNFAVPVSVVHRLIGGIPTGAAARSFQGRSTRWNLLISAGVFIALYWGYRRICGASEHESPRRATSRC